MAPPPACLPAACGRVLICVAICARRLHANAHITHRHLAQASAAAQPTPSLPPLTRRMAPSTRPRALHKRGLEPEDNKLSLDNSHRGRVNEIRSSGDLLPICIYVGTPRYKSQGWHSGTDCYWCVRPRAVLSSMRNSQVIPLRRRFRIRIIKYHLISPRFLTLAHTSP